MLFRSELAADEPGVSMTTIQAFQDQARQAKGRRLQDADQEVEIAKKLAGMAADVYDQRSYERYREAAMGYGRARGQRVNLPETYDEAAFNKIREHAKRFETILKKDAHGGEHYLKRDRTTGEETSIYNVAPPKPKDVTTWSMMDPREAKNMGLPDGGSYQRSNRGQVQAVTKPTAARAGGGKGGDLAEAHAYVDEGLAPDLATGLRMAKAAKADPIAAAERAATAVYKAQFSGIGGKQPGDEGTEDYETILDRFTQRFQRTYARSFGGKMTGGGTREDPYTPETDLDFENIPKGEVYRDPDDGQLYVK